MDVPREMGESEEVAESVWVEMWESVVWNRTHENCVLEEASSMGWRKDQPVQRGGRRDLFLCLVYFLVPLSLILQG